MGHGYPEPEAETPVHSDDGAMSPSQLEAAWADLRKAEAEVAAQRQWLESMRAAGSGHRRALSPRLKHSASDFDQFDSALSIVVPMGGLTESSSGPFQEAGFRVPKPLVNVVGRPVLLWLLDHLSLTEEDTVYCALPVAVERQYSVGKMLAREYPKLRIKVVTLPMDTRGWLETVLAVVRQMSARELRRRLVTLDCSNIYHRMNLLERCRSLDEGVGASVYFDYQAGEDEVLSGAPPPISPSAASLFSYVKLGSNGFITQMKEKAMISSHANTGAYVFRSGKVFKGAAEELLELPEEAARGGLYASALITAMLAKEERFKGLPVKRSDFAIISTPAQLEAFIHRVSNGEVKVGHSMRFCFDLDGTLVMPSRDGRFEPVLHAIELVKELKEAGHQIIITTSRGMAPKGSMGAAIAAVGKETCDLLAKLNIPCDELYFGKPHADIYIDSHTLNVQGDILRDLGWRVRDGKSDALPGAIDARSFNLVRSSGKAHVVKSSDPNVLRGEIHWYRSIPPPLARFFPEPLEFVEGNAGQGEVVMSSITMSKVSGVTFAHLSVSRLLMKVWLRRLVETLHTIHSQVPEPGSTAANEAKATMQEMCSNYASKVAQRVKKYESLYESLGKELGINIQNMTRVILHFLEEFETDERPFHTHYLHGDPVFSNVIRTNDDQLVLIDMRGQLGDRVTTQGDVHYDLSKVFQSLCGYDFMLLDQPVDEAASQILDGLRAVFWEEVQRHYPTIRHRDVRLHTAAHFFAIVPLHEVRSRMARYLRTSYSMLHTEGLL